MRILQRKLFTVFQRCVHNEIIVISGATATGKSDVAMKLGEVRDIEIVVADSVQICKYLQLGSNKPTDEERRRIPHHLVDIHNPGEIFSAGDYISAIKPVLADIIHRNKTPVIVGGNTMWIEWLIHGIPDAPKSNIKAKHDAAAMLQEYKLRDDWDGALGVVSALTPIQSSMTTNDWYRLHRQLEIYLTVKNSDEAFQASPRLEPVLQQCLREAGGGHIRCFFIAQERLELYRAIDTRCEEMIRAGLIEETCDLLKQGHIHMLPSRSSGTTGICPTASAAIGYRQTVNYLCRSDYCNGDSESFLKYLSEFSTATRNYAKRQLHWYRLQDQFLWLHSKCGTPTRSHDKIDQLVKEIIHWVTVPFAEYVHTREQQYKNSKVFAEEMNVRGGRRKKVEICDCSGPLSGLEYKLRGCEGTLDASKLRMYSSKVNANMKEVVCRADNSRRELESFCHGNFDVYMIK